MQCPNCGNEMAFMAVACPNCGQPGFGSFLNESTFTPKERAENAKAAMGCLAVLFKTMFWFSVGSSVILVCLLAAGWAVESPFVASVVHGALVFLKWLAITAAAFLPFGIISGLITNSTQDDFASGFAWGQLTGPIGLIVAIFQIPDKTQAGASHAEPSAESRDDAPCHKVVKTKGFEVLIRFVCPHCEKRYKVEESALGKRFDCGGCGHSSIVTRYVKNPSSSGN